MIIAGLDAATRSGIAILDGGKLIYAESFRPKGEDDATIFHGFRNWLRPLFVDHKVECVAIEEPLPSHIQQGFGSNKKPIGNMRTYLRLYGIRGHAVEMCHSLGIQHMEVNNKTWRKAAYGPTSPPKTVAVGDRSEWWKQKALERCQFIGWPIKSKDAAEAACIADFLRGHLRLGGIVRPGELFTTGG